jgi:glycine/D-amino acid oxidase-like deaminating enzyme
VHHPSNDKKDPPGIYARRAAADPGIPLRGDVACDVAIVGAGYTALSAALHLAEAGARVAVLEARSVGWGASGRAFGQLVPYLKHDHAGVLAHYGRERGLRIVDAIAAGPAFVFDLIDRHGIACDAVRTGLLFGAHSADGERALRRRADYWQARGAHVEMLDGDATARAIGSVRYYGASLLDHRGGHLNPLAYARGLGVAAAHAGATIYRGAPVHSLSRQSAGWRLDAAGGTVAAPCVILATNAYSGNLWPGLRQSFIAMRGHGLVSRPLTDNIARTILPGGQPLTDTRLLFSGVRMLPGGHLHVSLDGPFLGPERGPYEKAADARVARLFPHLGRISWQESWSGWIALTRDEYPRVHELAPGLFAGFGYSGRGIVAATMIGRELAQRINGATDEDLLFPLTPPQPITGHAFAGMALRLIVNGYRLRDRWAERRRAPGAR